ncbi:UpxY family transcription antiterminator [Aquirufa sp. ROCK2-A2]
MAWYALYTKSRMEKKVAERLLVQGIECYCPIIKQKKQWSDRKKWVEEPVFKSYVFVNINYSTQNVLVRQTIGVVNFVYWLHQPAVVQDDEIKLIQSFLAEHSEVETSSKSIKVGDFITLDSGAMMGQTAEVIAFKNKNEVRLFVKSLGFELVAKLNKEES